MNLLLARVRGHGDRAHPMRYTVIISTYNRARRLAETRMRWPAPGPPIPGKCWSSTTIRPTTRRQWCVALAPGYPVELQYVYEATHGKYAAMNTAVAAARGEIIAATDDDALVRTRLARARRRRA